MAKGGRCKGTQPGEGWQGTEKAAPQDVRRLSLWMGRRERRSAPPLRRRSVEETRLLVLDAEFAVNGRHDALDLTHGEHTAKEGVTRVVAMCRLVEDTAWLVGEGHAVVNAHWQTTTAVALALLLGLLEDAAELDEVATTAQVRCLGEVAVGEDVARTEVYEMGAVGKLTSHGNDIVVFAG